MKTSVGVAAIVLALGLALSACETATPYQPLAPGNAVWGGFTDQQLDENHFRVTFQGNSMTARERVENYLLFHAAELTLKQGYDWFEMVDRKTRNNGETFVTPGPWGYWHPYWRFRGRGRGWRTWDPFWDDDFWANDYAVDTIDRYEATAEIAMQHGPKPEGDPKALDARQVIANLGPTVVRPS